eukprot:2251371-Rhodomonas_salina.1
MAEAGDREANAQEESQHTHPGTHPGARALLPPRSHPPPRSLALVLAFILARLSLAPSEEVVFCVWTESVCVCVCVWTEVCLSISHANGGSARVCICVD